MDRDANRAVNEKLLLIDKTVLAIDVKMTTTQVFDVLRSHGLNARQVVGSGNHFAFSLPVERALARRCITALVDQGVVTTKVFDRPCNPSDPPDR